MTDEDFQSLKRGIAQVEAYEAGERKGFVTHTVETVDAKAVRAATKLTQARFASTYHIDIRTLQAWETKRRRPDRTASTLLRAIARDPETMARLLA